MVAGGDPDGAIKRRRSEMLLQRRVAKQAKVDILTCMHACMHTFAATPSRLLAFDPSLRPALADSPCGSNLLRSKLDRVSTSVYNVPTVRTFICRSVFAGDSSRGASSKDIDTERHVLHTHTHTHTHIMYATSNTGGNGERLRRASCQNPRECCGIYRAHSRWLLRGGTASIFLPVWKGEILHRNATVDFFA